MALASTDMDNERLRRPLAAIRFLRVEFSASVVVFRREPALSAIEAAGLAASYLRC
jgi:hypothetical protein